ncbi:MAG: hypothetical protein PF545_03080, partial [Elusimicrobia bacterium]|nr:hypothetical protein [Elusimicrobiota bacterium]
YLIPSESATFPRSPASISLFLSIFHTRPVSITDGTTSFALDVVSHLIKEYMSFMESPTANLFLTLNLT